MVKHFITTGFRRTFFSLIILLSSAITFAQTNQSVADLNEYANQKYGTSDFLVNGWKYFPDHFNAKGNPYFHDLDWTIGTVTNTGGQVFTDLKLRYNVEMDELVLNQTLSDGIPVFVLLNKDFVRSFSLGNSKFVKVENIAPGLQLKGYVEEIYAGKISLFTKHQKNFVANYNANTPEGSISKQVTTRYLLIDDRLIKVQSKKAFMDAFQDHKKEIKKFLHNTRINYKKASNSQLIELMQFCNEL